LVQIKMGLRLLCGWCTRVRKLRHWDTSGAWNRWATWRRADIHEWS